MERDPQISKLIREGGVVPSPEGFSGKVMDLVANEPEKRSYKPLIGRGGRILILLFLAVIVVLSIIFSEPGGGILESLGVSNLEWQLPQIDINFKFLSQIDLPTGLVSTLVAVFILVLSDAGLTRRRLV